MAGDDAPWHQEAIGLGAARTGNGCGTGKEVVVAVVDTGVDTTHPELCEVCAQEVEGITEQLPLAHEPHLRCNPALAQYIVDPAFPPLVCEEPFAKAEMDPAYVAE
jgi:hypothetical protein